MKITKGKMDISVITALFLLVFILVSPPAEGKKTTPPQEVKSGTYYQNPPQSKINEELRAFPADKIYSDTPLSDEEKVQEVKTLYSYIKEKHKNVSNEDAELIAKHLVDLSVENQMDPKFIAAVMAKESQFNKNAISRSGAKGLGQIKDMNFKDLEIENPYDIKQNTGGTIKYLKQMINRWKDKSDKIYLGLASYYKGYTGVKRSMDTPDPKADRYVKDIFDNYDKIVDYKKTKADPVPPQKAKEEPQPAAEDLIESIN